jgi:hypothetical protein
MMQEPVHGGGSEGLGHDGVEVAGVQVAADRQAAPLVGGVDDVCAART